MVANPRQISTTDLAALAGAKTCTIISDQDGYADGKVEVDFDFGGETIGAYAYTLHQSVDDALRACATEVRAKHDPELSVTDPGPTSDEQKTGIGSAFLEGKSGESETAKVPHNDAASTDDEFDATITRKDPHPVVDTPKKKSKKD